MYKKSNLFVLYNCRSLSVLSKYLRQGVDGGIWKELTGRQPQRQATSKITTTLCLPDQVNVSPRLLLGGNLHVNLHVFLHVY